MTLIFNQSLEVGKPRLIKSPYSTETTEDWTNQTWDPVPFLVSVQPNSTMEGDTDRPIVESTLILITPPATDIPALKPGSRVRVGGVMVLDVRGKPERWPDPFYPGVVHHLEAVLGETSG